jgi:hypothetical protein
MSVRVQLSLFLDAFEEAGDSGHYRAQAGNVVLHEAFDAHLDRIPTSGAVVVLNVPLPAHYAFRSGFGSLDDLDAIIRLVEKGDREAAGLLLWSTKRIMEPEVQDWPDELAALLAQNASVALSCWSEAKGISAWDLSRGTWSIHLTCESRESSSSGLVRLPG